eukprot:TRINITY_DN3473_c0_g1_i5.p1 TRINITY_DN3473_c0_g1~~TRINITY_DN3473_c0_g1_i5.p1  ORF type:complete len:150 (+),score=38.20 TRINITY_DN3473_c0_g1_i5:129-578(+)
MELINPNPTVYLSQVDEMPLRLRPLDEPEEDEPEPVDSREVFQHLRHINDPEHPLTLEQLHVMELNNVEVDDACNRVVVRFTPTIPHCSMATLIGLSIRVKLLRSLPRRFKVDVLISPGTHQSEDAGACLFFDHAHMSVMWLLSKPLVV